MSCNAKKDPNGTWRIQYRWTDWTGTKKKSQKRGFKTKKEAEEWYAHFMLQQSSDPTMTLADFWEIYKADMEKRLRKTTMKQKEYVMNDKILPYFGKTPINEITAPMIRKWQGEMMEKGFKPTYLKTIHNQLSAILNYAVNFYDLRSNPCRKAGSMGKSKADERPYWTLEEFQKFSDAIMDKQDSWIAFQILFWTGMRIGELLALQVKDIDFEQGTIIVDESLTRLDGEDLITAPKTESSVRVITIHKELQEELKEYIATLYHVRPGTRLFAGRTKSFFEHEMERGIKLSGVKKITIHCTRHSHASMLVQMGFSPVEIAKRLGHGKVTTTIETYCHQSMDAQVKIADRLAWQQRERAYLTELCQEKGIDVEVLGIQRDNLTLPEYKAAMRKVEKLEHQAVEIEENNQRLAEQAEKLVDQIAKLDEKEKDNKNVLKKYGLRADTLKTIAKETEKDTKKLKSAAIPVSNILGSEEYVKVKKSDWEKIIDAFSRAVSRNKLLEKYEKKIVALEKKVADVSGLLDKMKQFISNRGLGEAFAEFVKSLEPKTMKERLTEKQKVVKEQTQQKSMHTQERGTSRKHNISTEL